VLSSLILTDARRKLNGAFPLDMDNVGMHSLFTGFRGIVGPYGNMTFLGDGIDITGVVMRLLRPTFSTKGRRVCMKFDPID
jgi:hypothetical protein